MAVNRAGGHPSGSRPITLLTLVIAGESAFFLPFVLARVFRPTLLEVFGLTNLQLGMAFAAYGVVGAISYFPGGPLADRFSARKLLALALISTSAGGFLLQMIPSLSVLKWLYAYWGFTTIALFWAALIRATREWGGEAAQGSAFGWLDGGRGLVTAVTGSVMVALYSFLLPQDVVSVTPEIRTRAFKQIILLISLMTFGAAILVWIFLPHNQASRSGGRRRIRLAEIARVLRMPPVWVQAIIILCAYVGFKATDDFSLYASDVLGMNEVNAAKAGTVSLWMRPIAAIGAGYLADRFDASRMTVVSFGLLFVGSLGLASGVLNEATVWLYFMTIICASLGIFALRGLYYAIMKEGAVPLAYTGTAVGFVSVIGYTPDIFMGPVIGLLLDQSPGRPGHQHVFMMIAAFAFVGLAAGLCFRRLAGAARAFDTQQGRSTPRAG
jgi:sugar phosphate permease